MFSVEYDHSRGVIRMSVRGFWNVATVEACANALLPLFDDARAHLGHVYVLSDARDFPVQSQEVSAAFGRMETALGSRRDRMAMVVGSALAKMQGEKAVAGSNTAFFATVEEAEHWLLKS